VRRAPGERPAHEARAHELALAAMRLALSERHARRRLRAADGDEGHDAIILTRRTDREGAGRRPVVRPASHPLSSPTPVPRDWSEVFVGADGAPAEQEAEQAPERRRGFFRRLRENLSKTRTALGAELQATLFEGDLDAETWERLEEALIMADVGARTTAQVVSRLEQEADGGEVEGGEALARRLTELLADLARPGEGHIDLSHKPTVIMVAGVNGTGKTTTIGKLAWHLQRELGHRVILGAADTFRAAAVEQLEGWAQRAGCEIVTGPEDSDPGAVAFEAVRRGREEGADVVIVDTAGRLHTQDHLMAELTKVRRVIGKQLEGAPHETLLTVDATTGQNGLRQAQLFSEAVPVDGIVLTKLDGTAKGGIALAIAGELGIPVKLIGIGEALEDLRPFDADDFAAALVQAPE
jgi:fused signal recognition particle receptor